MHTPGEISQQPETWLHTLKRLSNLRAPICNFLSECGLAPDGPEKPTVILTGAGTSDFVGGSVSGVLRRQWGCEVQTVPSTELLPGAEDLILPGNKYLMISFSRSGQSSEGIALLEQMLECYPQQVRHLIVTCNEAGNMAKLPNVMTVTLDHAVNDRGLAMTSSFSNMVVAGQYLANAFAPDRYEERLHEMAEMGSRLMPEAANRAADLARKRFSRICFLGSGALHAVAGESALKVLELNAGRIVTLAASHLGLRHGPLSFVNGETLVVSYLSAREPRASYELDLLEELVSKALCAEMLIVTPRMTSRIGKLSGNLLQLEAPALLPDGYRPPVDVIAGQLLALFASIENGITPDTPSDGAIDRVVSHVKIYPPLGSFRQ